MSLTIGKLLNQPQHGKDIGQCYICGEDTRRGHRQAPSAAFTAWATVGAGDVICEYCWPLLKHKPYRTHSWLMTAGQAELWKAADRQRMWEVLWSPPDPPFAIYLTRARQKHGWLSLAHRVSLSQEGYWVGTDWLDAAVLFRPAALEKQKVLCIELRKRQVSRTALATGAFPPSLWQKALKEAWADLLEQASQYAGNPQWEVICYACP